VHWQLLGLPRDESAIGESQHDKVGVVTRECEVGGAGAGVGEGEVFYVWRELGSTSTYAN
jgi:hypothetical protein